MLSKRILAYIVLFFVLIAPSLAFTYYSYTQLEKNLTEETYNQRKTLANLVATTVEARLDAITGVAIATADSIAPFIQEGKWEEAASQIGYISKEFPYVDQIFITDSKGVAQGFIPPSPQNVGKDFSFRDWYLGVSKDWVPYVSEVFKRAPKPQYNTVAVAVPIKDSAGSPSAVLGFAINLDSFYDISDSFKIDQGGFLYIVNQKGQIVAHPKYDSQGKIVDYSSVPVVKKLMHGKTGIEISFNPVEKEERLGAYQYISQYRWGVVITDPVSTAFAARDETLKRSLTVSLTIIFLNIFLAFIIILSLRSLQKARQKEHEFSKLKDEFLTVASHELRTPMTAIRGFVSMILDGDYGQISDAVRDPLTDVADSTDRLVALVNDMLNLERIEQGRLKYSLQEIRISEVANSVVQALQPIAHERNLQLAVNTSGIISPVQADPDKVKQLLNNLIGNSLKFTTRGAITVDGCEHEDLVVVRVSDTGAGISAENQKKLFEKFGQLENASMGKVMGTGLGLYISKAIAQKMGGDLWLEKSQEGVGSTFSFSIPKLGGNKAKAVREAIDSEAKKHPDQKEMS